jgi:hypothetical protein
MFKITGTCGHEISEKWWNSKNGEVSYKEHYYDYGNETLVYVCKHRMRKQNGF